MQRRIDSPCIILFRSTNIDMRPQGLRCGRRWGERRFSGSEGGPGKEAVSGTGPPGSSQGPVKEASTGPPRSSLRGIVAGERLEIRREVSGTFQKKNREFEYEY